MTASAGISWKSYTHGSGLVERQGGKNKSAMVGHHHPGDYLMINAGRQSRRVYAALVCLEHVSSTPDAVHDYLLFDG